MIRGLFKLAADRRVIAELNGHAAFRFYVDKLRRAEADAIAIVMHCDPKDLLDRRAYARCLSELIEESTKTEVTP